MTVGSSPEGGRRTPRRSPKGVFPNGVTQREADALSNPTRFALYEHIRSSGRPLTVAELTDAAGVHHTAVRQHLAKLRDAGLVTQSQAPPSGRGRPRLLYSAGPGRESGPSELEHYRRLAGLLATAVRTGRTAREVGRDAGRDVAREVALHAVHEDTAVADGPAIVVHSAEQLGFRPTTDADGSRLDVVLHHCPFRDVAAEDPETVCSMHLGMAEGVAQATGGFEVLGMVVNDPYRAGCRMQLRRLSHD